MRQPPLSVRHKMSRFQSGRLPDKCVDHIAIEGGRYGQVGDRITRSRRA